MGQVPVNDKGRTKTLISFGASAIYYPKYLYANGFASGLAQEYCSRWTTYADDARNTMLKKRAERHWANLLAETLEIMKRVPGGKDIDAEINRSVETARRNCEVKTLREFPQCLSNHADPAPIGSRLQEGDLWGVMSDQKLTARSRLLDGAKSLLTEMMDYFDPVSSKQEESAEEIRIRSLPELLKFTEYLGQHVEALENDTKACPKDVPPWRYEMSGLASDADDLSRSLWLKVLGLSGKGLRAAKDRIEEDLKNQLQSYSKKLRLYLLRPALERLVREVIPDFKRTIQAADELLDATEEELKKTSAIVKSATAAKYDNILKIAPFEDVDLYLKDRKKRFHDSGNEQEVLAQILRHWHKTGQSEAGNWLDLFLKNKSDGLAQLMIYPLLQWDLRQPSEYPDLPKEAINREREQKRLEDLAKRSFPYCEISLKANLESYSRAVDHVCGQGSIKQLADYVQAADQGLSFREFPSRLDNMVVFYRQLVPVYADDLYVVPNYFVQIYDQLKHQTSGLRDLFLHTHLRQDEEFDKAFARRRREVARSLHAIQDLYPYEAFDARKGSSGATSYVFTVVRSDGYPVPPMDVTDTAGKESFCSVLAREDETGLAAKAKFTETLNRLLKGKGRSAVYNRLAELQGYWHDKLRDHEIGEEELAERNSRAETLVRSVFGDEDSTGVLYD